MSISIKTEKEIEIMRKAGKLLAGVMTEIESRVHPDTSTLEIDKLAEELILRAGARPAFKGYGGGSNPFPATVCASVNDEIVHGI
ncbi:MAG: hypothetical protein ACD_67C00125G0001, partial [uncultured bacterium]